MGGGVRSVHSLEFGKHGSFGEGIGHGAVASLGREAILLHLHRLLLAFFLGVAFQRPHGRWLMGKDKHIVFEAELVDEFGMGERSW